MKKTILILSIILVITGCNIIENKNLIKEDKNEEGKYKMVIDKYFEDSKVNIKLFESKKKVFDTVPEQLKLVVKNNEPTNSYNYEFALIDETNNTGGCLGDCTTTLLSESGEIPNSNFEKLFDLNSFKVKRFFKEESGSYYYNYHLMILVNNDIKNNNTKFFYSIDNSYGRYGENKQSDYIISGGQYKCDSNKVCKPIKDKI